MKDYVLRLPPDLDLSQRTPLKNAVASLLGDRHDGAQARYLFSPDPLLVDGPWLRLRLCGEPAPAAALPFLAEIGTASPENGRRIEAAAWVALKARVFNAETGLKPRVLASLGGFRDVFAPMVDLTGYEVDARIGFAHMERGRDRFGRAYGRISFSGVVTDRAALEELLRCGIGAAKAYGFGLICLDERP